jgi:hypothetical protein
MERRKTIKEEARICFKKMYGHSQAMQEPGGGGLYNLASDCDTHIDKDTRDNNRVQQYSADPSIAPGGE